MQRVRSSRRGWGAIGVLAAACLAAGGCQFKGESGAGVSPGASPGAAVQGGLDQVWAPRPTAVRVYPSTRFVEEGGLTILESRVEFSDVMGDSLKAAGDLRFDLFAADESGSALGRRLYNWQLQLRTLEDQYRYYDPITRTYLFRLRLDDREAARRPTVLQVSFTPADRSERLEAQALVRR